MGNRLYVSNLSYQTTETELQEHFQQCGTVSSVQIVLDRETNRSRGFGFITMGSDAEAQAAIDQLNGQSLDSRSLRVSEARPREERPQQPKRSFGGGGGEKRGGFNRDRERGGGRDRDNRGPRNFDREDERAY
jgi:RNA recognition motif-containing protein